MKIIVELDLTERQIQQICQNSIERVMNNAITVGSYAESKAKDAAIRDRASTLWQDCEELKPLNVKIWDTIRNRIFELKLR